MVSLEFKFVHYFSIFPYRALFCRDKEWYIDLGTLKHFLILCVNFHNFLQTSSDDDAFHFHGPRSVRKWVKRRRRRQEEQHPRSYVKGKVIDGKHELYTISIAVMLGMRTSIGRTNMIMSETSHNERRWLDNDDLMAVEKYVFPPRVSTYYSWIPKFCRWCQIFNVVAG